MFSALTMFSSTRKSEDVNCDHCRHKNESKDGRYTYEPVNGPIPSYFETQTKVKATTAACDQYVKTLKELYDIK
ncbi:MAG: hypothetical protein H0U49_04355 [Parachlamydiaceae bacterium]|nr:hypothetical protein [Parachlamydiaceae bacterium]